MTAIVERDRNVTNNWKNSSICARYEKKNVRTVKFAWDTNVTIKKGTVKFARDTNLTIKIKGQLE